MTQLYVREVTSIKKVLTAHQLGFFYAYVHFAIEVSCFFFLYSRFDASPLWWMLAFLYDALAFVPQSFFGLLADHHPRVPYGIIGCATVLLMLLLPLRGVGLVILALGNALTHIDGAEQTLHTSGGRITPTGLFVGGGSFGVITGQLLGRYMPTQIWIPVVILALALIGLLYITLFCATISRPWHCPITSSRSHIAIVLMAFIAVTVRAYIAYAIPTDWNKTTQQAILLFVVMGIGKIGGGILSDRWGHYRTAWISSLLSLPLLLFGNTHMLLSLIGVGLFSMTMPITIAILVNCFPSRPCFAFGITTVGLFCGTLPAFFIQPKTLQQHQVTVLVLIILALCALLFCLEKRSPYDKQI